MPRQPRAAGVSGAEVVRASSVSGPKRGDHRGAADRLVLDASMFGLELAASVGPNQPCSCAEPLGPERSGLWR
jgi:hypothetical protein